MKRLGISSVTLLTASLLFGSCASSRQTVQMPAWASSQTINTVFPNEEYIARIGYGKDTASARAIAEAELGTYFSHSLQSSIGTSQVSTTSKSAGTQKKMKESISDSQRFEQSVTIEAANTVFDVRKTDVWFNPETKQYVCCAYINRSYAWALYQPQVRAARDTFRSFYDAAEKETEPIKKLHRLTACEESARDFIEKLDEARFIKKGVDTPFLSDRKCAETLDVEIASAQSSLTFYVTAEDSEYRQLSKTVSTLISQENGIIVEKNNEAAYSVIIDIDPHLTSFGETMTAESELSIILKHNGRSAWSYQKILPKESGFSEAEELIRRRIVSSAEKIITESFPAEFKKLLNPQ